LNDEHDARNSRAWPHTPGPLKLDEPVKDRSEGLSRYLSIREKGLATTASASKAVRISGLVS
jgi:hypothetical protein